MLSLVGQALSSWVDVERQLTQTFHAPSPTETGAVSCGCVTCMTRCSPIRRRERQQHLFKSQASVQRFLTTHGATSNTF